MDGILLLNKPPGITSFKVVDLIKKKFGFNKVGHGGTLDPFATGLLIILIERATKLFDELMGLDKRYSGTMMLGAETDTQDLTGKPVRKFEIRNPVKQDKFEICSPIGEFETEKGIVCVTEELIEKTRKQFLGKIQQVPPMVSALHYKGQRLYMLAKKGTTVPRKPREIVIRDFQIHSYLSPYIDFFVTCSKGTYIRTLCHDFGRKLGCGAHLFRLNRDKIGPFSLNDAATMDDILEMKKSDVQKKILSKDEVTKRLYDEDNTSTEKNE